MRITLLGATLLTILLSPEVIAKPLVIAHRGASGYLPEHTLEAKALAYAMKPDYIEQDVVMTKDDQLVVLHDHYLDRVTDVATRFPNRVRQDGRYYVIDFTLAEIKSLRVTERVRLDDQGKVVASYPDRFPLGTSDFRVATLAEEIELIQGLNQTLGYDIGIYPEIKVPWFHRYEGKDISRAVLEVLNHYGYRSAQDRVYLQSFDANELRRIHDRLLPQMEMTIPLVQLMAYTNWNATMMYENGEAKPYSYDWMFEEDGMQIIAEYADAIGPWKSMLVESIPSQGEERTVAITPLMHAAKQAGLQVHPYTFRADKGRIPTYAKDFEELLEVFIYQVKVDGIFTDFPDKAVQWLNR